MQIPFYSMCVVITTYMYMYLLLYTYILYVYSVYCSFHENSGGLSSATNPKPKGLPSHCLVLNLLTIYSCI